MKPGELAESLISDLAIRDPKDLDVEAIAVDSRMEVRYRQLQGCAATLVGNKNRAIATISPSGNLGRDRFSIGHELGHWKIHRGQSFYCRAEDFGNYARADQGKERQADEFSSRLLMPTALLRPAIGRVSILTLDNLNDLATTFSTSTVAMALRVTMLDNFPVVLSCYSARGREWFRFSPMVPTRWRLKGALDEDSFAYDYLNGRSNTTGSGKQSADAWFENSDADEFEVREEFVPYRPGKCLVLLYIPDEMLEAERDWEDWRAKGRR